MFPVLVSPRLPMLWSISVQVPLRSLVMGARCAAPSKGSREPGCGARAPGSTRRRPCVPTQPCWELPLSCHAGGSPEAQPPDWLAKVTRGKQQTRSC